MSIVLIDGVCVVFVISRCIGIVSCGIFSLCVVSVVFNVVDIVFFV